MALLFPMLAAAQGTEAWHDFARRSLTPDYSWNEVPSAPQLAPQLRDVAGISRSSGQSLSLSWGSEQSRARHSLSLTWDQVAGTGANLNSVQAVDLSVHLSPLQSRFLGASYEQDVGSHGRFAVSALVSRQQYATPGFGISSGITVPGISNDAWRGETVSGHGVRLDYRLPVGDRLAWQWTAQSRLDMDALESVHGIYAEPGDFDLPARLGTQVQWQALRNLSVSLGIERVYYGQITPFTSPVLPDRLLSLMADGSAPDFAWRDLTIYSAEGRWSDHWQGEWSLRYNTRQQPSPTAALYRQALQSEYTNVNVTFGYHRGLRSWGEMHLTASYAPSMAFLGPGPAFASQTYARGATTEFEASWLMRF